jgi:plastocyanin
MLIPVVYSASAESIPEWIRNNALWYGQGIISETEFLNGIKFLIENDIIILENMGEKNNIKLFDATVIIPNGNYDVASTGFYIPLNLEILADTTVTWINQDNVKHTIQSQDELGNIMGLFNSALLDTGEKFEFTFEEEGVYNYYCSLHPWRVGLITVK